MFSYATVMMARMASIVKPADDVPSMLSEHRAGVVESVPAWSVGPLSSIGDVVAGSQVNIRDEGCQEVSLWRFAGSMNLGTHVGWWSSEPEN